MSYYIHHKTKGYDFIDLTTNTVVRSFSTSNTYNVLEAVLNDLYIKHSTYDFTLNMMVRPDKKFTIYVDKWIDTTRISNVRKIEYSIKSYNTYPFKDML